MKFLVAKNVMGSCVLCRGPIFGEAVLVGDFDLICMCCANGIAETVMPKVEFKAEVIEEKEVFTCPSCDKEFKNQQALAAHIRHCKGGSYEQ